jgi:capsular exopolysaccharide synthesis family protein
MVAVFYLSRAPRVYEATAVIQIEQTEPKVVKFDRIIQDDWRDEALLKTFEQTLVSRPVLEAVIRTNNLQNDPRFLGSHSDLDLAGMVGKLEDLLSVRLRKDTRLLSVTVAHTNPELCASLANSVVQEFGRLNFQAGAKTSHAAHGFLQQEAERLKRKLSESEQALQAYREQLQSVSMEERQNIVMQKLKELTAEATSAKAARVKAEADYNSISKVGTNVNNLRALPAVAEDPTVREIELTLIKQQIAFAEVQKHYKEKHPKFIEALASVQEWQEKRDQAIQRIPEVKRAAYEETLARERALEEATRRQENVTLELSKQALQYAMLSREVESDLSMYNSVLNRLKETALTKDMPAALFQVVEPAYVPDWPVKPNKPKLMALSILTGVVGGILLALFVNTMDRTLKSVDQSEEELGLPVLVTVPERKRSENRKQVSLGDFSLSPDAEDFHTLRNSLEAQTGPIENKVFLFTSALPYEGKTFCAVHYSLSLASQGLRTMLVDADLRRPTVEQLLVGKLRHAPGVSDFLVGASSWEEVVQYTALENFSYIPSGTHPRAAHLLDRRKFDLLMASLIQNFDRVVIDSPPLLAVSDALIMLNQVQTVCLVVRYHKTPARVAKRALEVLTKCRAPIAGVILNRLPRRLVGHRSYKYHYEYTYRCPYEDERVAASKAGLFM